MLKAILCAVIIAAILILAMMAMMYRTMGRILDCLYSCGDALSADDYGDDPPDEKYEPPDERKSQAPSKTHKAPLVRKAQEQLTKRRNEATNG